MELYLSIIAASAPALKPFFRQFFLEPIRSSRDKYRYYNNGSDRRFTNASSQVRQSGSTTLAPSYHQMNGLKSPDVKDIGVAVGDSDPHMNFDHGKLESQSWETQPTDQNFIDDTSTEARLRHKTSSTYDMQSRANAGTDSDRGSLDDWIPSPPTGSSELPLRTFINTAESDAEPPTTETQRSRSRSSKEHYNPPGSSHSYSVPRYSSRASLRKDFSGTAATSEALVPAAEVQRFRASQSKDSTTSWFNGHAAASSITHENAGTANRPHTRNTSSAGTTANRPGTSTGNTNEVRSDSRQLAIPDHAPRIPTPAMGRGMSPFEWFESSESSQSSPPEPEHGNRPDSPVSDMDDMEEVLAAKSVDEASSIVSKESSSISGETLRLPRMGSEEYERQQETVMDPDVRYGTAI